MVLEFITLIDSVNKFSQLLDQEVNFYTLSEDEYFFNQDSGGNNGDALYEADRGNHVSCKIFTMEEAG